MEGGAMWLGEVGHGGGSEERRGCREKSGGVWRGGGGGCAARRGLAEGWCSSGKEGVGGGEGRCIWRGMWGEGWAGGVYGYERSSMGVVKGRNAGVMRGKGCLWRGRKGQRLLCGWELGIE